MACLVRSGGNRCGRFLEVAVYAVDGQRGMTMFLEGQDGRGWSCVFEELSKALTFLEATVKALFASGAPVGDCMGKAASPLSFAKVVRSKPTFPFIGGGLLVHSTEVAWCEVEKLLTLSLVQATVRQSVDCSSLETSPIVPLGIDRRANGSLDRSNVRDSRFQSNNRGFSGGRLDVCVGEAQGQEGKEIFK